MDDYLTEANMQGRTKKIASRDKEQFCAHIDMCKINMFRLAKSILHNDLDAEEATSEAIYKAYSNLNQLKSYNSFRSWIMKITINEAYKLCNLRKKVMYLESIEVSEESAVNDTASLWSVVNTLEEDFRTVAILFYYEDMSIKDISRVLDLPTGTVKSRLSRARYKLKDLLTEERSK